jgi:glycosyltransferase A (GT-A) superfamily protein (DUF2064 family)
MRSGGALAIFVKTPGLSAVKTRLAASIGKELAGQFYSLSIDATKAVAQNVKDAVPDLKVYWSVAEAEGLLSPIWRDFPCVPQGDGSLGARLGRVYEQLIQEHEYVCFIGADSPHLAVDDLNAAILEAKKRSSFVLGETVDGGFYFFGGSAEIPRSVWESVEYSSGATSAQLKNALRPFGEVENVDEGFDIDTLNDLLVYQTYVVTPTLLPEQENVIAWVWGLQCASGG